MANTQAKKKVVKAIHKIVEAAKELAEAEAAYLNPSQQKRVKKRGTPNAKK